MTNHIFKFIVFLGSIIFLNQCWLINEDKSIEDAIKHDISGPDYKLNPSVYMSTLNTKEGERVYYKFKSFNEIEIRITDSSYFPVLDIIGYYYNYSLNEKNVIETFGLKEFSYDTLKFTFNSKYNNPIIIDSNDSSFHGEIEFLQGDSIFNLIHADTNLLTKVSDTLFWPNDPNLNEVNIAYHDCPPDPPGRVVRETYYGPYIQNSYGVYDYVEMPNMIIQDSVSLTCDDLPIKNLTN